MERTYEENVKFYGQEFMTWAKNWREDCKTNEALHELYEMYYENRRRLMAIPEEAMERMKELKKLNPDDEIIMCHYCLHAWPIEKKPPEERSWEECICPWCYGN
jgi:hypothetical protein